jgi:uncharacterized membrane protein YuzA (DUF378 family)
MTPSQVLASHPVLLIANFIVLIGALNWLLIGTSNMNLVSMIFGAQLSKFIYILVGISAIYVAICKGKWLSGNRV